MRQRVCDRRRQLRRRRCACAEHWTAAATAWNAGRRSACAAPVLPKRSGRWRIGEEAVEPRRCRHGCRHRQHGVHSWLVGRISRGSPNGPSSLPTAAGVWHRRCPVLPEAPACIARWRIGRCHSSPGWRHPKFDQSPAIPDRGMSANRPSSPPLPTSASATNPAAAIAQIRLLYAQAAGRSRWAMPLYCALRSVIRCRTAVFFWVDTTGIPHIRWTKITPPWSAASAPSLPEPGTGTDRHRLCLRASVPGVRVLPELGRTSTRRTLRGRCGDRWRASRAAASIRERGSSPMLGSLLLYRDERDRRSMTRTRSARPDRPVSWALRSAASRSQSANTSIPGRGVAGHGSAGRVLQSCERSCALIAGHSAMAADQLRHDRLEAEWTQLARDAGRGACSAEAAGTNPDALPVCARQRARTFTFRPLAARCRGGEPRARDDPARGAAGGLRLALGMRDTALSPTQQQVALALLVIQPVARGSPGVRHYGRTRSGPRAAVYDKLQVHERMALRERLLGRDPYRRLKWIGITPVRGGSSNCKKCPAFDEPVFGVSGSQRPHCATLAGIEQRIQRPNRQRSARPRAAGQTAGATAVRCSPQTTRRCVRIE